jgi:hypothetical protein
MGRNGFLGNISGIDAFGKVRSRVAFRDLIHAD